MWKPVVEPMEHYILALVIIIARVPQVQDTDLDGLMNLPRRGVVVSVVEPVPPVAEVR